MVAVMMMTTVSRLRVGSASCCWTTSHSFKVQPISRCYSASVQQSTSMQGSSSLPTAGTSSIPIIDFGPFLKQAPGSAEATIRKTIAGQIVKAFKTSGFIYLKNHGLAREEVSKVFEASKQFFALPTEVKDRLAWKDPRANRGYVAQGRERVTQATDKDQIAALRQAAPDYKESLEIGREVDATFTNLWPKEEELPGFRETMLQFRRRADKVHLEVLRAIAIGLNLPADFFDAKCNEEWHTLRLLHYPSIPVDFLQQEGTARAGSHSDYGSLTLLFQDNVGGLEVQDPKSGEFLPAPPIEDTIVINVADLLARWSNDTLRSTLHRVVAPRGIAQTGMTPARYSIAYFMNPNEHQLVEALPSCVSEKKPRKYDSVVTSDYLAKRLSETYT